MAFILTWLKLSSTKQLAWYRRSNHQSKDIAHGQKVIAQRCADKVSMHMLSSTSIRYANRRSCSGLTVESSS